MEIDIAYRDFYVCTGVCMFVCMRVRTTQVYKYTSAYTCKRVRVWTPYILIRVCVRACVRACLRVCVYFGCVCVWRGYLTCGAYVCACVRARERASERA